VLKLDNEEFHNLYSSTNIIKMIKSRRMRWAGHIARTGEKRNSLEVLVGKPKGKIPLGKPSCRLEVYLGEIEWDVIDWIRLARDRDQ
jgi:hypothetical protein